MKQMVKRALCIFFLQFSIGLLGSQHVPSFVKILPQDILIEIVKLLLHDTPCKALQTYQRFLVTSKGVKVCLGDLNKNKQLKDLTISTQVTVKKLLEPYKNKRFPLLLAVKDENPNAVEGLIIRGADVNVCCKRRKMTPLHYAAGVIGDIKMVKLLLAEEKIKKNARECLGYTPLLEAICYGRLEIVKLLLADKKVDKKALDNEGLAPLFLAVLQCQHHMAKVLLTNDEIERNPRTGKGFTPLYLAAREGYIKMVRILVADENVDKCATNNRGHTPLEMAKIRGHKAIVKLLEKN